MAQEGLKETVGKTSIWDVWISLKDVDPQLYTVPCTVFFFLMISFNYGKL